jgi:P4 family phage/plasmid primase-like protien
MSTMKKSFDSYLNSHYSQKGQGHTHTRIGDANLSIKGGAYTISNMPEFYQKYVKHVFEDGKFEFLTEKQHIEAGPLLIDFDFRYSTDIEEKQHTEEHINDMVDLYFQEIKNMLDIPESTQIPVFIFEKEDVNMLDEVTKDGIHMIIGIHMDRSLQVLLRLKVLRKLSTIWDDLPLQNTWDEVLDEGITNGTTNWQLYGSRKPGNQAYLLKKHYDLELDSAGDWCLNVNDITTFDLKSRFRELSAQYTKHAQFELCESIKEEYDRVKENAKKKPSKNKNKLKIVGKKNSDILSVTNHDELEECIAQYIDGIELADYYLKETHFYTMCLGNTFFTPFDKWIRVGWALKNTHESLFISWIAFSAQSDKFDFDKISDFYDMWSSWDRSNEDGLTYRSIMYWAKHDNYTKYKEIREETIDYFVEKTIDNFTDFDVANVLFHIYKDDFVCVSIKRDIWYIYEKNRWLENEGGTNLRMAISKELFNIYYNKQNKLVDYLGSGAIDMSSEKASALQKKAKTIGEISMNLKRRGIKDNIMREAKEIFYDKDFIEKVDANPKLVCFNNGVFDFEIKEFRKGKPDDYLSKSTMINYITVDPAKKHKKQMEEIDDFMHKLFPDKDLRNYMWDHLASTLIGENNDQTFNIYNGSGSNGKSKLVELMGHCLGDYKATVPITLIAAKRNSIGSTSSEVVQLKGVRYAVMQEPSKGDKINEGIMKEITGGDPLQGRALFKDSITFIPQFKLVVCTNTLLDVGSNDDGTWRRICVCEFISRFAKKNDFEDDREHQFELDKKLKEKFTSWAPVFMSMLVDRALITDGMVNNDCAAVKSSSLSYRNTQDYYSEFVSDKVKKSPGSKVKETSLYEVFKNWFQLHHGKNIPKGRELFEYMNKRYGKKVRGVWNNVSIIYDDFDNEVDEYNDD